MYCWMIVFEGVGGGVEGVYNRVFRMDTEIKSCPSLNVMS